MAQPPAYIIETDFSQEEANNLPGRGEITTASLDTELINIKAFIDVMRTNIALIQRDDTQLADLVVTLTSLSEEVSTLLLTEPSTIRGAWVTATAYNIKDIVTEAGVTYLGAEAHTSGVFATDLTAGRWIAITSAGLSAVAVKSAYESNANTNEFDDAEQTKLAGVESGATADQTDGEIKTAYENNANTNAFTNADESKLDGIVAGAEVNPDLVSQAEAETGTSTVERIWSALRVAQAISIQKSVASQAEAETGTDNVEMMTPLRVLQSINANPPAPAAGTVDQASLKSTTAENSIVIPFEGVGTSHAVLTGGQYSFWVEHRVSQANSGVDQWQVGRNDNPTTFAARCSMQGDDTASSNGPYTMYIRHRYIQASPPYDLGDGDVFSFIFARVNNSTGLIEAMSHAPDPPWANNGPTNIHADRIDMKTGKRFRKTCNIHADKKCLMDSDFLGEEEIEITPAFKNADMHLIPHPFIEDDLKGKTVVLIDPMSSIVERLEAVKNSGDSGLDFFHEDYIRIGNENLKRGKPPGVMCVSVKMK